MTYATTAIGTQRIIHKKGGPIVLIRQRIGAYDPLQGPTATPPTPLHVPLIGVVKKPSKSNLQTFQNQLAAGTTTRSFVRGVLLAGLDVPDDLNNTTDMLSFDGATWGIIGWDTVSPDGTTKVLYDLLVAR